MKKRITAIVLSIVTAFSIVATPAQALNINLGNGNSAEITNAFEDGYPMPDVGNMIQCIRQFNTVMYTLTGAEIFSNEVFDFSVDSVLQGVVDYITNTTGVDFSRIYKFLPQTNQYAQWITTTFAIDTVELQTQLNAKVSELMAKGEIFQAYMVRWVCVWMGIIEKCELECLPVDGQDGVYKLAVKIYYKDGRTDSMSSNIYYNSNTNEFTGKDGKNAFLGFGMDLNQVMTYTDINVWQRKMGFCLFYDFFSYSTIFLNYVTQRIKFTYDNREWMIQMWKGRYLIANGAEVGIYNRDIGSKGSFYNCAGDEDMMTMSLDVYHSDKCILHRDPTLHWWITGFAVSDTAYLPFTMTVVTTITMKDEEMLRAFTAALDGKKLVMDYTTDGLNVTVTW